MLILRRNKGLIYVNHYGKNGRLLNSTKSFTQKPSALANIKATLREFGRTSSIVMQDYVNKDGSTKVYKVSGTGKISELNIKPKKISINGVVDKVRKIATTGRKIKKKNRGTKKTNRGFSRFIGNKKKVAKKKSRRR